MKLPLVKVKYFVQYVGQTDVVSKVSIFVIVSTGTGAIF